MTGKSVSVLCLLLLLLSAPVFAERLSTPVRIYVGPPPQGIRPMGTVSIARQDAAGTTITGISALAWDGDEGLLYALTDNGVLHHLRPGFDRDRRLVAVTLVATYKLGDGSGEPLQKKQRDSEGMFALNADNGVSGDTELVISFEKVPRIMRYSPRGEYLSAYVLPTPLREADAYSSDNQMLEAVTLHPDKGILTMAQRPMKGRRTQLLHALSGESWEYRMEGDKGNGVTAMEALPDGRIIFMERAWHSLLSPLVVTLKEGRFTSAGKLQVKVLARLDSSKGWTLDNFEGLTRHQGDRFFMVSDDNKAMLQRTLLFYFELEL
jgi:hypothetical protein